MYQPVKIAPSILSADFMNLGRDIRMIEEGGAAFVHIDVMDGHFVPNLTMGVPLLKQLKPATNLLCDVHLMIDNPLDELPWFIDAGADLLNVHVEALDEADLARAVAQIHEAGLLAAAASEAQDARERAFAGHRRAGHGARHVGGAGLLRPKLHRGIRFEGGRGGADGAGGRQRGAAHPGGRRHRAGHGAVWWPPPGPTCSSAATPCSRPTTRGLAIGAVKDAADEAREAALARGQWNWEEEGAR